ncbi:MAG: CaiB/BaiF CoA-transferase family protein [Casimicrobiaceae bacterium]
MSHDRSAGLPLAGVRVVEFAHMVMGPSCGLVLADLGAEVIKIEPLAGDSTRRLPGAGAGFFGMFNRNKQSVAVDVHTPEGHAIVAKLIATADIVTENFRPGSMAKLGFDYAALAASHPRLVYVSHKGFLPGPYESRTALDEVVQMMGGLAYMTGPEGRPLRAGTSVNDIMGGMFGAIGALAALRERDRTGKGQEVQAGLFENNVFLVGIHMLQYAVTGTPAPPMPSRISAWGIYDVFTVRDGATIFLAVVSDGQWTSFCDAFGLADLKADARLATNRDRVHARDWLIPVLRERFSTRDVDEVAQTFERQGLPYARIARPHDLYDDPHLLASGGLAPLEIPADGSPAARAIHTLVPLLPVVMDAARLEVRSQPPPLGADTARVLSALGYSAAAIDALAVSGTIHIAPDDSRAPGGGTGAPS